MNEFISKVFIKFTKRAEKVERELLVNTFVDVGPLMTVLSTLDNQVLYGRRGTGKTHALVFLDEAIKKKNEIGIYIDMRNVGSNWGIYGDPNIPLSERATRLMIDVLAFIRDEILDVVVSEDRFNLGKVGLLLDELAVAISEVTVTGTVEEEYSREEVAKEKTTFSATAKFSQKPEIGLSAGDESEGSQKIAVRVKAQGSRLHRVHFGRLGDVLNRLSAVLGTRIWIILDEWSVVPLDIQPYLADLLRRGIFPIKNFTVKIGAIEKRSCFQIRTDIGDYIGIELGGDASADLNMDDFMVFDNDEERSISFFKNLVFKHFKSIAEQEEVAGALITQNELFRQAFTQDNVFKEFVRAAEGIPRDAFSILSLAAQKDFSNPISMATIRRASREWFQRDKESAVSANQDALRLLHWIVDNVIAHRRARGFLLERNVSHPLIDELFDARVLHLLKRNISAHDQPGVRYDVYKIDYGCYVDLLSTARSPLGLMELDDGKYIDVPLDDYRAIRRAILELAEFEKAEKPECVELER